MSLVTTAVTLTAYCQTLGCDGRTSATAPTDREARAQIRARGWVIVRTEFTPNATYCPRCARTRARLIREGILSPRGIVLDAARYEAHLDARVSG